MSLTLLAAALAALLVLTIGAALWRCGHPHRLRYRRCARRRAGLGRARRHAPSH
ncbi:hypothetical protein QTN24_20745 [Cupriavidus sp. SZY C1]|uniref:hypothetical protein n=1 Tax=Cupriavidus sp. SZY C1 TaxID=3055037 RepID=UPI0028BC6655|nr:hypothetical protein [Cupriavidus sp. SZY C1]MDT6963939.1 hypothetical protein [Cupriavidus sp. SZY C1]